MIFSRWYVHAADVPYSQLESCDTAVCAASIVYVNELSTSFMMCSTRVITVPGQSNTRSNYASVR